MKREKQTFFERQAGGEEAILVHVEFQNHGHPGCMVEFKELAISAGIKIQDVITARSDRPEAKYLVGTGKAESIRQRVEEEGAQLVLFIHNLSPAQERNLEKLFNCRVIDRTSLILDIFAQRARSFEGKLQVELAQLKHLSTRLVRGWTHLERQKGGIGLRGPGEKQLETDRRLVANRIKTIEKRLEKVHSQRQQSRRARHRAEVPTIALVGYTNAGKSTIFNRLTSSEVYTAHQLFATLDPTLRYIELPYVGKVIVADTVGFIRELPHDLVAAFRATLEETRQATLLLHVVDASHPERDDLMTAVHTVLKEIEADQVPVLEIFNKIDLMEEMSAHVEKDEQGAPMRVWCSTLSGEGWNLLTEAIIERLGVPMIEEVLHLNPEDGAFRARLYEAGVVVVETVLEDGSSNIQVRIPREAYLRLMS